MDFKQIEAFVHVVKHKSFSRAADAIFLTQPTISAHISSLEKELGMKLIDRSGKDVEPTAAGKLFYQHALNMINTRDSAIYSLNEFSCTLRGKLELAASTVPSQIIIPRLVLDFCKTNQDIHFSITQMDSEQVAESIMNRQYEIGIVGTKPEGSKLASFHLADDKLVLITPNAGIYAKEHRTALPFSQLTKESFIIRETGSGTRREFERIVQESGLSKSAIQILAQMNSIEAIKQSVSIGLGVSIVSLLSVQDYLKCGLLKAFDIEGLDLRRAFYAIYLNNRPLSPLSSAFLKFMSEYKL